MRKILVLQLVVVLSFLTFFSFGTGRLGAQEATPVPSSTPSNVSSGGPSASTDAAVMEEVVITANRLDTPISQIANSMTVITAQEIEQKQAGTALDALQDVPGLTLLQNGAPGENSGIFMRGADSGHTLVLLDGIPLNNPISTSREFDNMDQLFLEDVSQIEVVRGPLSTVYGTNATAGVVNIITQKPGNGTKGSLMIEGGSYDTLRQGATASVGSDLASMSLSLSRFETGGFPSADRSFGNVLNDPDSNSTASLKLGLTPGSGVDSSLYARYINSSTNIAANSGANGDDPNNFLNERTWVVGSQTHLKLLNGTWEQVLGISYMDDLQKLTDDFSSYVDSHYERGVYEGQTGQVSWQNNVYLFSGETFVAGIQGQQEWGREDDISDYGYGSSESLIDQTTTTGSYFAESQTTLMDHLFVTLGGRLDAVSSFGDQFTYRGAVAYFVPDLGTKLKATYGTGFKAPSIYQLYSEYGATDLQAENSTGWDLGFEQPLAGDKARFGATYFHTDYSELIDFVATATPPYGVYVNVSKAQTLGWETFASFKPLPGLEGRADYTYTWAVNQDTGEQLVRRPQNRADLGASYTYKGATLGFNIVYVGDRPDVTFDPLTYAQIPVSLPSYTLVNLNASYQLDKTVKLYGRVDNLFNTVYEEVYGYGTPGLSVYAGTKFSL